MVTGYEVGQFRDITRIAKALERIAMALEQIQSDAYKASRESK